MTDRELGESATLGARLRAAHAAGAWSDLCPAPETFLADEWSGLSSDEQARLEAHAHGCAACAAERDLARMWDADASADDLAGGAFVAEVAAVVAHLGERSPVAVPALDATGGRPSNVVPFPGRRRVAAEAPVRMAPAAARTPRRSIVGLAIAAVLALAIGLAIETRQTALPDLPPAASDVDAHRGGSVLLTAPEGMLEGAPGELRWEPVTGAASYRVALREPLGAELWSATVAATDPRVALPAVLRARLETAVRYSWSVEALDGAGARIAASEPLSFTLRPAAESAR